MAIKRHSVDFGNFIKDPGEYKVKVKEIVTGLSKSQKPMLTVTFVTADNKMIKCYFVKDLIFHMKALGLLKLGCKLKENDSADNLVGKECGIAVEEGKPDEKGRIFMQVTGFGMVEDVENKPHTQEAKTGDFATDNGIF